MKKALSITLCLSFLFAALLFTGCAAKPWPVGTWTLSEVTSGEGRSMSVDTFQREVFDLGDTLSSADMQRAAGRSYCTKLTLNEDGTGAVEYKNPFGSHTEECTWHEFEGSLEIIFNSRAQFKFEGERRSMTFVIKESFTLESGFTMTVTLYTLKYAKN